LDKGGVPGLVPPPGAAGDHPGGQWRALRLARAQQQRFDRWRKEFNEERPHEGLGMRMPAAVYHPSARRLDERVKPRLYQPGTEIRRVDPAGYIGLAGGRGYVGESFVGVDVALERSESSDLILVRYANVTLGRLDTSANPRLLPAFSDKGWEDKPTGQGGN